MIEKPLAGWAIAIAFYGLGIIGGKFVPNVFCIWTACQYILFFFIGMRIRVKSEKQERLITEIVPWYCWLIADLVLSCLAPYQYSTYIFKHRNYKRR